MTKFVTFLLIPALPPSQVSCDPALVTKFVTFLLIPALPPSPVQNFSTVEKKITLMIQSGSGGAHQVEGGMAGISKNVTNFVTHAGSQLTWEGGRAGISKNVTNFVTHAGSQLTF